MVFLSAVFTHFLSRNLQLRVHLGKTTMEPNSSVSAHVGVGQNMSPSFKLERSAERTGVKSNYGSAHIRPWRLLFVHEHCGEFAGAEANIYIAAQELCARGHAVGLIYEHGTCRNEQDWRRLFRPCLQLPCTDKLDALNETLRKFRPDLVYLHNLGDLELLESLLRSGIPSVRMVHDHSLTCLRNYKYNYFTRNVCHRPASLYCVVPCLASFKRSRNGILPLKWASYSSKKREMRLTRSCASLVVYSQYQKEDLVRNGFNPSQIELCAPIRRAGHEPPVSSFGADNILLYVGQIIRGKGVDVLLEALAKVNVPFRCHIVGDGTHRAYCERVCERLKLGDRVQFHGYVPPAQLESFYLEATAFLMSSLWPEPFGMSGPEAMRYGLPVVAFDVGGIPEWLKNEESGFLVPWRDTDTFAARVEQLLTQKDLARRLGQRGKAVVKQYDPSRQMDKLENLFCRVIKCRKATPAAPDLQESPLDL